MGFQGRGRPLPEMPADECFRPRRTPIADSEHSTLVRSRRAAERRTSVLALPADERSTDYEFAGELLVGSLRVPGHSRPSGQPALIGMKPAEAPWTPVQGVWIAPEEKSASWASWDSESCSGGVG